MKASQFILALVIGAMVIWGLAFGGRLPKTYRQRVCQGRYWRNAFPYAPKQEIRAFLSLFVSAFAFDDSQKLKLTPTDEILKLYRARYPCRWTADALELETLCCDLQQQHGIKLEALWRDDLTLGELFAHVQQTRLSADGQPAH